MKQQIVLKSEYFYEINSLFIVNVLIYSNSNNL